MVSAGDDVVLKAGRKRKRALTWLHSATAEREQSKKHTHQRFRTCRQQALPFLNSNELNSKGQPLTVNLQIHSDSYHTNTAWLRGADSTRQATDPCYGPIMLFPDSCSRFSAILLVQFVDTLCVKKDVGGEKKERRKKSYGGSRLTVKSHLPPGTPAKCKWRLRVALRASTIIIPTSLRVSQHSRASVREQEEARTATRREEEEANGGPGQLAGPGKLQRRFGFFVIDCVCTCVPVCCCHTNRLRCNIRRL